MKSNIRVLMRNLQCKAILQRAPTIAHAFKAIDVHTHRETDRITAAGCFIIHALLHGIAAQFWYESIVPFMCANLHSAVAAFRVFRDFTF